LNSVPLVIGSANAAIGLPQAMDVLRRGGSALDAVETAIRAVESNPEDHTVGLSGLPNLLGEVELDASLMDGRTLAAGAVAAVRRFEHPISIARRVMEELPHVLLAGEGAERFAREMGFPEVDLATPAALEQWKQGLAEAVGLPAAEPAAGSRGRPAVMGHRERYLERMRALARRLAVDPEKAHGTVNVIARDLAGNLASGVSTSGWAWKYPGRVGDSPVIGAGNYCDNRYGAAACTGRGEMTIRLGTARSLVLYLQLGRSLIEAGRQAMLDLDGLHDPFFGSVSIIAVDARGRHAAFSDRPDARYVVLEGDQPAPVELPRVHVPIAPRSNGGSGT